MAGWQKWGNEEASILFCIEKHPMWTPKQFKKHFQILLEVFDM